MLKKRLFDILFSAGGLLILAPLFLVVSILILGLSGAPIFFIQKRVGLNGVLFKIIKFRTMKNINYDKNRNTITTLNDSRVTDIGKLLRRWKLDELPTLLNVVRGQMSLVGPRPDVPGYADNLIGDDKQILLIRPGITSPATLKYANEEELLSKSKNHFNFNNNVIYPDKVRINLYYIKNRTFWIDLKIILFTIFRKNY